MTERIRLGTVIAPSGVLVVIDPGYAALWAHTEKDFDRDEGWSFEEKTMETARTGVDIRITGQDAAEAGRRFNRQWHCLWLYDIPEAGMDTLERSFRDVIDAHNLDAVLEINSRRIPHRERVDYAVAQGGGAGEIQVHGVMNAVCGGIPSDSELAVYAEFMPEDENETRWRRVYVEIALGREIASSERIGGTGVDWARLMFVDADALGAWGQGELLDGLADLIFWEPTPKRPPARSAPAVWTTFDLDGATSRSTRWTPVRPWCPPPPKNTASSLLWPAGPIRTTGG